MPVPRCSPFVKNWVLALDARWHRCCGNQYGTRRPPKGNTALVQYLEMSAVNARSATDIIGLTRGHGFDVNQLVAHHFASLHVDATETYVTKRSHMQMG